MNARHIMVVGGFDDLRSAHFRFLEEAAKLGEVTVCLWSDDAFRQLEGKPPQFPQAERRYFLEAVRFVKHVLLIQQTEARAASKEMELLAAAVAQTKPDVLVVAEVQDHAEKRTFCAKHRLDYLVLRTADLQGFPDYSLNPPANSGRKKVVVTGCYDWFHSGHVRFFEEVSAFGDLYVIVGHDANIRLLKGAGHPLLSEAERRYLAGSIRYVTQALISSGKGWLDADPEIRRLKPDIYAVNEDGDKGGKREYCQELGIEYLVLKRIPAPGLPQRSSTVLRGF